MSLWSTILTKIKEILGKMIGTRTIEQTLHVTPIISSQMEEAINLWADMYKDQAPWVHEPTQVDPTRVVSLGLPSMIASEKARTAFLEWESEITTPTEEVEIDNPDYEEPQPDELGNIIPSAQPPTITEDRPISDTARAEYLNSQYQKLKNNIRREMEYGFAKGGLVIKPYVVVNDNPEAEVSADIYFDYIQADSFYPLSFDASGNIKEAAFVQTKTDKDAIYRRLEYHKFNGNSVTVINKAFKAFNNQNQGDMGGLDLGREVPLTEVPEWASTKPEVTVANVTRPLFAYFKYPEANTIDTISPLGVSCYSRAKTLIKDADMQYSRLLWEYEAGEMAVNVDRDAFQWMADKDNVDNGYSTLGSMQKRLYRRVDITDNELFEPYAPALRDEKYVLGLNTILMRIEDVTGLSRGTLSDAVAEARTATELKILKQRSFSSNADIQKAIQTTLEDVVYIMNTYATLYEITPEGEYDVSFDWDDSILVDKDAELNNRLTLQQNGLVSKLENRMWYFGETERQAQSALVNIEGEALKAAENNLVMQGNMEDEE